MSRLFCCLTVTFTRYACSVFPHRLADLLGVDVPQQPEATKGKSLRELIRPGGDAKGDVFN